MTPTIGRAPLRLLTPAGLVLARLEVDDKGLIRSRDDVPGDGDGEAIFCPGFVDIHVHGALGCDVVGADEKGLRAFGDWLLRSGVVAFVATLHAAPLETLRPSVELLRRFFSDSRRPRLLGLHFEGPFLSPQKPGALPVEAFRLPDGTSCAELIELARGLACIMTVAPERPGAIELIRRLAAEKVVPAFGHSAADERITVEAIEAGLRHVTHCFNAMPGLHHRRPGPIPALLLDGRVTVELICDGHHVHPDMVRLTGRCIGAERLVLVSDATAGAGLPDGPLTWAGRTLHVAEGAARLGDGTLAGSTLGLDRAVRNLTRWGFPVADALRSAGTVPLRALGRESAAEDPFLPGRRLEGVLLDPALRPSETWIDGRLRWRREPAPEA